MLVIFSGLPATGKTTLAKALAAHYKAVYLRIDTIEQALERDNTFINEVGSAGYTIAYALAEENLKLGQLVIADSVNPLVITRSAWHNAAKNTQSPFIDVEIICSDKIEHQRRAETRTVDVEGLKPPTWESIINREYEPWHTKPFVIDTALLNAQEAIETLIAKIQEHH